MSARASIAAIALSSLALSACSDAAFDVACVEDSGCGEGLVCAFGGCVDPNASALGLIDLHIEPGAEVTVPPQAVLGVDPGAGARLDVSLKAGVPMFGEVLRNNGGVAAQVIARPFESIIGRALAVTADSDEAGRFAMLGVEDERYAITIVPSDPGLPPLYDDIGVRAEPGADGTRDLPPYTLPADVLVVTGRIVAGEGASLQGIPSVEVRLRHTLGPRAGRLASSSARTAPDGTFSLALAEAAANLMLEVRPTDENEYAPTVDAAVADISVSGLLGDVSLGLVLSPVRFTALVLDEEGVPAPASTVMLAGQVGAGRFSRRGTSDAAGEVALDVPPGVYDVVVLGPDGRATGLQVVRDVTVPVEAGRLTLQLPPRARVTGSVLDPTLGAVAHAGIAFVRVGGEDGLPEPVLDGLFVGTAGTADAEGAFDVALPPGRYRVNVTPPLSLAAPPLSTLITVEEGGFSGDLELPARAIVTGTLRFEDAPVPDAYVRVFGDAVSESGVALLLGEGQVGADGRFEVVVAASPDAP